MTLKLFSKIITFVSIKTFEMTEQEYQQEIEFIFNLFPSYQKVGKVAYKPGIESMEKLDAILGHPHTQYPTIHVAGTNGKGSTTHMLAAVCAQGRGVKVGLYTSPHLVDFRERIRINGEMISKEYVYNFLKRYKDTFMELGASFFEITTALALKYFADEEVDIAIIECGLGGRLDSTNIITPKLSIITNIGLDHCEYLGYTLTEVAAEKAGIIKPNIPIIIGEKSSEDVAALFARRAAEVGAPILFAEDFIEESIGKRDFAGELYNSFIDADADLKGDCQQKNIKTVIAALSLLGKDSDIDLTLYALCNAAKITGLRGRWERLCKNPLVICDTGHNAHGFKLLGSQICRTLESQREINPSAQLKMIFGVVADKDLRSILNFLPKDAYYYYVNAKGTRALPAKELAGQMNSFGFIGEPVEADERYGGSSVQKAVDKVLGISLPDDFIFIGGSTFVVAEAMEFEKFRKF